MAKIHLAKPNGHGARSPFRYSSRPSRKVRLLPLQRFVLLPDTAKCSECTARAAEMLGDEVEQSA